METELYIRATADDKEKAFEDIAETFGEITVLYRRNAANEFAFITELDKECVLTEKLNSIKSITPCSVIRVTDY